MRQKQRINEIMEYNLNYSFDENLHDIPDSPGDMRSFIQEQKEKAKEDQSFYRAS